jgi:hypothetical protein
MNKTTLAPQAKPAGLMTSSQGILQRKCACGSHTSAGGECEECAKKKSLLQRKLTIGASNDPLEQEADRIAEQVMSAPLNSAVNATPPKIQRFTGQASEGLNTAPVSVDHVLATSSGRPLEPAIRKNMEQRFGRDFSLVRIFTGGAAEQSALDMQANAYTVGKNIVFGAGQYVPETQEGQKLIAHELTHVIQQNASGAAIRVQRFAPCRHLLDASEQTRVREDNVRDSVLGDIRRLGPAETEFPILGGTAAPLRTEPPLRGGKRGTEVIPPQIISSDIFGRADIAALNGTALELIEVKRATWEPDGVQFAELQLLRQVLGGNRAIRDVQQRWHDRGHPNDTVTSVRGMPMSRFTPQTPRRIGGIATSLAWCRDGVLSFKAIGDRDPEVFICGTTDQGRIDSFLDRGFDQAQAAVEDFINREVLGRAERAVSQASLRDILMMVLNHPEFRSRLPVDFLGTPGGAVIFEVLAQRLAPFEAYIKALALEFVHRVVAELRQKVQAQIRNLLQESLNALCIATAANTAILLRDLLDEFNRRIRQFVEAMIPVVIVAVAQQIMRQIMIEVAKAIGQALAIVATAVVAVLAAIALWEFIAAAGIAAAIEAAVAAVVRGLLALLPALA